MRLPLVGVALALALVAAAPARADTTEAECAYETYTADSTFERRPCTFSENEGHVAVVLEDGTTLDFMPAEGPGAFTDADGGSVIRRDDLGDEGLIFITDKGMLSVYW